VPVKVSDIFTFIDSWTDNSIRNMKVITTILLTSLC